MAGIDTIIKTIEDNTALVCDDIIAQSRHKADGIIDDAKRQADAILSKNEERVEAAVKDIAARGESAAALMQRRIGLDTKQSIIADMVEVAKEKLLSLPDDEYFDLILKMIEKNSQPADGIIRFNQKDLDRLPADFDSRMNKVSKGKLSISKEPIAIEAGFVLIYGGIEENCSFDAVFASEQETISDRATRLLF